MDSISSRLHTLMKERGLGPREVERMTGITASQVSRIASGSRPNPSAATLGKLATGLGVSLEWLTFGTGTSKSMPVRQMDRTIERDQLTYTELEPILAMLRAEGEPAGVIAALEAERLAPDSEGHNADYWWNRVAYYRAMRKGKLVQHTTDADDLDVVPGKAGR